MGQVMSWVKSKGLTPPGRHVFSQGNQASLLNGRVGTTMIP